MPRIMLDDTIVDYLATEDERQEIRDKAVKNLELRVTRCGSKTWVLRYREPESQRQRTLTMGWFTSSAWRARITPRPRGFLDLSSARLLATMIKEDIDLGIDPSDDDWTLRYCRLLQEETP